MIKLRASVTLEDGTSFPDVRVMPGDVVRFERHFGIRIADAGDRPPLEQVLFLAWSPLHRKAMTSLTFDEFCDQVDEVDMSTGGAASPTDPAPSEDDSSN